MPLYLYLIRYSSSPTDSIWQNTSLPIPCRWSRLDANEIEKSDPIGLSSGPPFTDPTRPLFSGYTRLINTSADGLIPSPVGICHGGAECVK